MAAWEEWELGIPMRRADTRKFYDNPFKTVCPWCRNPFHGLQNVREINNRTWCVTCTRLRDDAHLYFVGVLSK